MAAILTKKQARPRASSARGRGRVKLPQKRSINLATVGQKPINWLVAAPAIALIIAAACLISKFAVVDRFMALSAAQQRASALQAQVDAAYIQVESYGELVEEYAHYTYSGMTEAELDLTDRIAVMDLLERVVMPQAALGSWSLVGNQLNLPITGATLQQINTIVQQLQADPMVSFCTVDTASTNTGSNASWYGDVTAQVTVYLVGALQAAQAEEANGEGGGAQ